MKNITAMISIALVLLWMAPAQAFWIWTPQTKKWINPKYAVKDTPEEQFNAAMMHYKAKEYERAQDEFKKLVKHYPRSSEAPDAQHYLGLSYEGTGHYYEAFQAYQKALEEYPHSQKFDEMVERQYRIGELFYGGAKVKVWKVPLYPSYEKAAEIFQKVVDNAPFGKLADRAQYMAGESYKKAKMFNEASLAFMKVVNNYSQSVLLTKAKFQVAYCSLKASPEPGYDDQATEKAIEEYRSFIEEHPDSEFAADARDALNVLLEKKAAGAYGTAEYYEKQNKLESAAVYYHEIVDNYPATTWAAKAKEKLAQIKAAIGE